MKSLLTTLFFISALSFATAQQIDLTGQVSIHNSRYRTGQIQYVAGASVQAPFAGETSSDSEGMFQLTFNGLEEGSNTSLTVEKAGLEVINERDILHVVLGRKQPLNIFLAKKGELAQRQTELYEVSVAALTAKHDALIASLRTGGEESVRTIQELEQQLNREIEHRYEAEDIIREQLDAAKERLPGMAKRLAEVNLDFASAIYRQAYDAYVRGDIPGALALLDEEALADKADGIVAALSDIEDGQQDFQLAIEAEQEKASQVYESYALKADAYELVFDYRSATNVLRKGVDLLEAVKVEDDLELAEAFGALASTLQELGEYTEALIAQINNTSIKERLLSNGDKNLGTAFNDLATIYQDLGDYKQALAMLQKSLSIQEQALVPDQRRIAVCYYNLASLYLSMGQYDSALIAQQKEINILLQYFEPTHSYLSNSYNSLAMIHLYLENYEQALSSQQTALVIEEKHFAPNHPSIATSHNNLASIHYALGKYEEALLSEQKALSILTQTLEPQHPDIAATYNNLATMHLGLGDYHKALSTQKNALAIQTQILDNNHPTIALSYNNLAQIYFDLSDFQKSLVTQHKALSIQELVLEKDHPEIANSYNNLLYIYARLGKLDSAIIYGHKTYEIWQRRYPKSHPNLKSLEENFAALYAQRAMLQQNAGQHESAIADYTQAIEFSEEQGTLLNQLGLTYYDIGKYETAINLYEKSYRQAGINEADYLNNMGLAYAKWGKLPVAKQYFSLLESLQLHNGYIYYDWGLYYTLTGDYDTALDKFEEATELGYGNWVWLSTEEALTPLRVHPRFQAILIRQTPVENKE